MRPAICRHRLLYSTVALVVVVFLTVIRMDSELQSNIVQRQNVKQQTDAMFANPGLFDGSTKTELRLKKEIGELQTLLRLKHVTEPVQVAAVPCPVPQKSTKPELHQSADVEIARRFAKLPLNLLSADDQTRLLQNLMPDSMKRWSCNQDHAESEKALRSHPAMHSNLDGQEYFNRFIQVVRIFGWQRLENKTFLELGFGIALMTAWLRGMNTTVYATEIQPIPWVPSRHGPFFDVMYDLVAKASKEDLGPRFDLEKAAAYGRQCGRGLPDVKELTTTMERLDGVPAASVDVSFSLAVLEHISELEPSFMALARVHRPGSLSCHQVDLRDHSDPTQPWEFFLTSDKDFYAKTVGGIQGHPYFGNRFRLSQIMKAAASNGFETVHVVRDHEPASPEGLRYAKKALEKLDRLPADTHKYSKWPRSDFNECTSNKMPQTGLFICFRYAGGGPLTNTEEPTCGQDVWYRSDFSLKVADS
ncbi:unnamed protein product [Polarella glacialis]|uniref:Uncharacterized protein n=1 Tax=Polarella glacialis TaxID=89957 RepID=A0A813ER99_POLGL|nr:unnamed protein product [Polarella glacialis]